MKILLNILSLLETLAFIGLLLSLYLGIDWILIVTAALMLACVVLTFQLKENITAKGDYEHFTQYALLNKIGFCG